MTQGCESVWFKCRIRLKFLLLVTCRFWFRLKFLAAQITIPISYEPINRIKLPIRIILVQMLKIRAQNVSVFIIITVRTARHHVTNNCFGIHVNNGCSMSKKLIKSIATEKHNVLDRVFRQAPSKVIQNIFKSGEDTFDGDLSNRQTYSNGSQVFHKLGITAFLSNISTVRSCRRLEACSSRIPARVTSTLSVVIMKWNMNEIIMYAHAKNYVPPVPSLVPWFESNIWL